MRIVVYKFQYDVESESKTPYKIPHSNDQKVVVAVDAPKHFIYAQNRYNLARFRVLSLSTLGWNNYILQWCRSSILTPSPSIFFCPLTVVCCSPTCKPSRAPPMFPLACLLSPLYFFIFFYRQSTDRLPVCMCFYIHIHLWRYTQGKFTFIYIISIYTDLLHPYAPRSILFSLSFALMHSIVQALPEREIERRWELSFLLSQEHRMHNLFKPFSQM